MEFSVFDCKVLNVYAADGKWTYRRWAALPNRVILEISGKACPQAVPSQVTPARWKMLSFETADCSAACCYCRCKERRNIFFDFRDLYLTEKKVSPRASSAWLKKSNKRLSSNRYLIADELGSFIPSSDRQVASEQCSGYSLVTVYCSHSMLADHPARSAPVLLWGTHFLPTTLSKQMGSWIKMLKLHNNVKKLIQRSFSFSPDKWWNCLIFLSSSKVKPCWPPSEPQMYLRGLAPCLITRMLSMMEPIFK